MRTQRVEETHEEVMRKLYDAWASKNGDSKNGDAKWKWESGKVVKKYQKKADTAQEEDERLEEEEGRAAKGEGDDGKDDKGENDDVVWLYDIVYNDGVCAHGLERDQIRSEETVLNVDDDVKGPHIALLASTYEIVTFEDREKSRDSALDGGNWANDSYAWFENLYDPSGDLAATGIVSILAAVHGFDVNKEEEKLNVEHFLNELASGPGHEVGR